MANGKPAVVHSTLNVHRATSTRTLFRPSAWSICLAGTVLLAGAVHSALGQAAPSASNAETINFSDEPNFTVAGVTDWTAVGGHGSDASLRTTEALTRETIMLKADGDGNDAWLPRVPSAWTVENLRAAVAKAPDDPDVNRHLGEFYLSKASFVEAVPLLQKAYRQNPEDGNSGYELAFALRSNGNLDAAHELTAKLEQQTETANLRRLSGEIDEGLHDPLAAVREFERAVRLDPSETNYFTWGAELLLHRAVWQAQQVFALGASAYPKSARLQTGLGTAFLAGGLYEQAAARLCEASDLAPQAEEPYTFLGKLQLASPQPLACVQNRLARFVHQQPGNAIANYYYAMVLLKRRDADKAALADAETLLNKAVTAEPNFGSAYLQLGILASDRRDLARAVQYYRQAIAAEPNLGEAHYRLGVVYDRQGETALSKQEFALHDQCEEREAAEVEEQRKEVKQFLVVLGNAPAPSKLQ